MFYGATAWDPFLIVAQIVFLQCQYYVNLGLFLSILVGPRVSKMSLVYFDFATVTPSTPTGWCVIASILLSSIAGLALINDLASFVVMALLGKYLCMKRELRDIPIGRFRSNV